MSQATATTGRPPACSSANTSPASGCVGSSGSIHTGTASGGSGVDALATTTASRPASRAASSGHSTSGIPSSSATGLAPPSRRPRPPASTATSAGALTR